jgi:endonuclease III
MLSPKTPEPKDLKRRRNLKNGRVLHSRRSLNFGDGMRKEISIVNHTMSQELESKRTNSEDTVQFAIESVKSSKESAPNLGNFPSPEELCELDVNFLSKQCGLGYRAQWIWKLAKDVSDGTIDLQALEICSLDEARNMLRQLHGFGPFTCANVLTCMGKYDTIPIDTETVRHIKQVFDVEKSTFKTFCEFIKYG